MARMKLRSEPYTKMLAFTQRAYVEAIPGKRMPTTFDSAWRNFQVQEVVYNNHYITNKKTVHSVAIAGTSEHQT